MKGLSRVSAVASAKAGHHHAINVEPIYENVEPIYEHIEPVYENVEPITDGTAIEIGVVQPHIRGFAGALVEGDRAAVFAGLRQHIRGPRTGTTLSKVACLIDDVNRSRIDGTACDPELARLTARLIRRTLREANRIACDSYRLQLLDRRNRCEARSPRALTILGT